MRFLLFILLTNNIVFSQLDGFKETYKRQIQLGKIDKSKTEFFNSKDNIFSNYKYGFSFQQPKGWKYDNGSGLITVYRTGLVDKGVTFSVNILELDSKKTPSIFDIIDYMGIDNYKSQYIKKLGVTPTSFKVDKTYFKNTPSVKSEIRFVEQEYDFEIEWNNISMMFWKDNLQFTLGLNIPLVYYEENRQYYDNLFYGFNFLQKYNDFEFLDESKFLIDNKDIREINTYDLKSMVEYFLDDCRLQGLKIPKDIEISSTFEILGNNTLGVSLGKNTKNIIIKINPEKWSRSSLVKKWYLIYHELGHDVLNFDHGEGGKMMFTFSDREYVWGEFFEDKDYMFNNYIQSQN